jgi:hypothetical protein
VASEVAGGGSGAAIQGARRGPAAAGAGERSAPQAASGGSQAARRDSQPSAGLGSQPAAPASAPPGTAAPAPPGTAAGRQVERAAELTLTPRPREIQAVADGVARTTQAIGGYVESSQVSTTGDGGSASLRLRLPSARLATAIERLSALAPVGALSQSTDDITGATGVAAERVADARAERRALLRALGRATSDRQVSVLRERLRLNRSRLAAAKGALAGWRRRARLATVNVTVRPSERTGESGGAWTPRDALHDALGVLQVAAGVALVAAAVLLPLLLLAFPVAVAVRIAVRRRREHALDGV